MYMRCSFENRCDSWTEMWCLTFHLKRMLLSFLHSAITITCFAVPVSEWQSLPVWGFLFDHTFPHRLPLQTAKGKEVINMEKYTMGTEVGAYFVRVRKPQSSVFDLFLGCIYHKNLPPKYQQQWQHLSWHPAITVVSSSHHLQRYAWFY